MKTTCTHQPKQCEFREEGCQYMVMLFYFTDKVATIIYCPFITGTCVWASFTHQNYGQLYCVFYVDAAANL